MAKSIMIQGTMSNVGKSLLVAGLCRIFKQDGYRVAPFKSQNMALNSYITKEGLEMGRAQVMQAEAACIEPSVRMNPVLLKPSSDVGSQVIVNGEVVGNMCAAEYYQYKKTLRPIIEKTYEQLAKENDIVVLEGAGSPAEINLKSEDFVNMGMAQIAGAPVLLAGDINPGGVFAQLYGTIQLLEEHERAMVKGLVINKFRGDAEILRPGLAELEALCKAPVLGIVPYIKLDLDDEDSLAERLDERSVDKALDVAVVRLPHLANFTDFNPLSRHPQMGLRYVEKTEKLGRPDLLIVPGSKNTLQDMHWLWDTGMGTCIQALGESGTFIIGICGGYQMLGEHIADPYKVEKGGEIEGLGLLPMHTVFHPTKTRTRLAATLQVEKGVFSPLNGCTLEGYEIHMGQTAGSCPPAVTLHTAEGDKQDGGVCGNVLGTYLHGFFDAEGVVEKIAGLLLAARGLKGEDVLLAASAEYKNQQYNLLAQELRKALDMKEIYRILEAGI